MEEKEQNFIYGKNPVYEAIVNNPKRINKIFIQKGFSYDKRLKKIVDEANLNKIIIKSVNLQKFEQYFDKKVNFQGVVASVAAVSTISLEEFLNNKQQGYKKLVALDRIQDPHNFGAIIRTIAAAGFDGVLIQNHRSAPINSIVEKSSSGAINHIPIIKTTSLNSSIEELKKHDYWVIATDIEAKDNYYEVDYNDMNFVIVMGSEGEGISKTILNKADYKVKINSNFESLNVSVALGVVVYEAKRQIEIKNNTFK